MKKRILIIEANPQSDLHLNDEIQKLKDVIRSSRNRQEFEIDVCLSVSTENLQGYIFDYEPNIIHFCGHGSKEGLEFRDRAVSTDTLSTLFRLFKKHLQCVVMNACYSEIQAKEIVKHIDYVIGMNQAIRDNAAIAFSTGFYQALGYGRNFDEAFQFGCNAIQLLISDTSITKDEIHTEIRKLVPVSTVSAFEQKYTVIPEHQSANNLGIIAHLANHIAVHRITQKKYDQALEWLQQQEQLVNQAELETREHIRHQVCIAYYRAEIHYWKWKKTGSKDEYHSAQKLFEEVYRQGEEIKWQRFTNYAQNWLADLLIINNDLKQAEKLLKSGLFVAESNRERRRIGHYYSSYARLEAKKKDNERARDYAEKALDIFNREGISEDAKEMCSLIDTIGT